MAREKMVTRTIVTTKCVALCIDVDTAEPFNKDYVVPDTYKDEKKLLKVLQRMEENENVKVVHIVDLEEEETLYGMTEADFIKYSKVLPPRGTK